MKRTTVLIAAMLLTLSAIGPAWASGSADRQTSGVESFVTGDAVEGAVAQLIRTDTGVSHKLRTSDLEQGHAISIWWVIFNNPEYCDGDCTVDDLFVDYEAGDLTPDPDVDPDVDPAVMNGGGNVVGGSGKAGFAAHLNEGQITNEHPAFLDGPGLTNARGAEIHLVVRSHGPKAAGAVPEQISTFMGGCDESLPEGEVPEEQGECADVQFAVFK